MAACKSGTPGNENHKAKVSYSLYFLRSMGFKPEFHEFKD